MLNPTLSDLVGGIQPVTLGDEEARRRGTQKTVLDARRRRHSTSWSRSSSETASSSIATLPRRSTPSCAGAVPPEAATATTPVS